ncbi:MAG: protein-L-isoaspartate(D-aspartate) O-methyltransferase [Beijerinckiaceae bacterium]
MALKKKDFHAPGADEMSGQAEAKAAFMLRLRAHGVQDLDVLRALERVPRELFVPHLYADLARRDLAVPIGCGQTLSEPSLVAKMIEALALSRDHRVLEIGTGSGYATAILAEIAHHVVSIERFQSLAIAARLRLEKLAKRNVEIIWGDGLALPPEVGIFDRILVHGQLVGMPSQLVNLLGEGGRMILARQDPEVSTGQRLVRLVRDDNGGLVETDLRPCRLQSLVPGYAQSL